ncbi:MAG: sporulation protein YunB [Gemmiger sp.]|nr:sporulation protein YunB [Gemmiger sp.]
MAGLLLLAVCVASELLDAKIKPTLETLAEYEARHATTEALRSAVMAEMAQHPAAYSSLYTLSYTDAGSLQAIQANAAAMNEARLTLTAAVQAAVEALPETRRTVQMGSLLGSPLLSHLGPAWLVHIQPRGYVSGEIEERVETVGINQTAYHAELAVQVVLDMMLDGHTATLTVEDTILLATVVVRGDMPSYYLNTAP